MTPERFETLADAYGGDVARWPPPERDAAALILASDPAWAGAILTRAGALDAALDGYPAPPASAELMGRILQAAPKVRAPRWIGWLLPAGMGAGLAAACAAGVIAGAAFSPSPPDGGGPSVVAASEDDLLLGVVDEDDFSLFAEEDA